MRTTLKRALVAGAVAVSIGVPVGAYATSLSMDTDEPGSTEAWTPPRRQAQDCDAPEAVRTVLEDPAIAELRADHQEEMTQLREEWRADPDPDGRDAFRDRMTTLREEHRAEVLAAVGKLDAEAAAWLTEHWAEMTGQGFGQGGMGQGMGRGMGNGAAHHGGGFGGGMGQHTTG